MVLAEAHVKEQGTAPGISLGFFLLSPFSLQLPDLVVIFPSLVPPYTSFPSLFPPCQPMTKIEMRRDTIA